MGYVVFQCLGAIFATGLVKLTFPRAILQAVDMVTPALGQGETPLMGFLMELVLTFFLVFVVFGTVVDARAPKMGGLFIGLTVALDILASGPISGAAMNRARDLGPAVMGGGLHLFWLYWTAPLAGSALAAATYHYMMESQKLTPHEIAIELSQSTHSQL